MRDTDENFFKRADEHISLSNEQLKEANRGRVSASMLYSVARFNAWLSATGWNNSAEMKEAKEKTVEYFINEYKMMLEQSLDDYINNFDSYMNYKATQKDEKKPDSK